MDRQSVARSSSGRSFWLALSAALALVILRSFVFLFYEQNFDSDQAIVGLMAKHLSEFRALPLFFYGQHYMLGVESWIAVPFFWIGGPTVTMLRLPLALINAAVVALLFAQFVDSGLRPDLAFVAVLPIAACGPLASAQQLTALGASVEPLLYVILLWLLRRRPIAFGVLLCIGSLHREFTLFALPPILLLDLLERQEVRWRAVASAGAAFGVVWVVIDQLKRHVNIAGPGADAVAGGGSSLALEAVQVGRLLSFQPSVYFARLWLLLSHGVPDLFGARPVTLVDAGIWGDGRVGSTIAGAALAVAVAVCTVRLVRSAVMRDVRGAGFETFLALVGVEAIVAYGLHGGTRVEARPELNYVLLALLVPVALFAVYFRSERDQRWRTPAALLVAAWAAAMTVDNARVVREYLVNTPDNNHRMLADYLTGRRIKYAWAGYWDSYRVTFLSRERVIVASTESVRIPGYQVRVERNASNAARIVRMPCAEGARIAEWCVVDPFGR